MKIFQSTALALVTVASLAGCASMGNKTPEQQVEQRANEYWNARVKGDFKTAYSLLTPAFRELNTEKDFVGRFGAGASLQGATVAKVTCDTEERCVANIALTAKPMVPGLNIPALTTYLDDVWVKDQQQWWRFEGQ